MDMKVNLAGLHLNSPIVTASGTFGFGEEFSDFVDFQKLGAIVTKGLTLKPRSGNEGVRLHETPSGILNCIGLENPGVEVFVKEILPRIKSFNCPIIANISGNSAAQYAELAARLDDEAVAAIEVNVSCPNVKDGGIVFGTNPKMLSEVVFSVRKNTKKPLIVKLTPNVTDITELARAAEVSGADVLSLINTLTGMAIDVKKRRPVLGNVTGGLSGPCVKPVALYLVHRVHKAVKLPLIGMGGVQSGRDVVEFMLAGASAVAAGTMNLVEPDLTGRLYDELLVYLEDNGCKSCGEIVGGLLL